MTQFDCFPQLPVELRLRIWQLALPLVDNSQGVCVLPKGLGPLGNPSKHIVYNPWSPLRAVNTEARQVAVASYSLTRQYDESRDIFYVDHETFYEFCDMCRESMWPGLITHLAIALSVSDSGAWLPIALTDMHSIETISIVYPQTSGEVDRSDKVPIPKALPFVLREFTKDERKALRVKADYLFDVHGRDFRIRWNKGTKKHLNFIKKDISDQSEDYQPPCWDRETNSLGLKFQARCFQVPNA
ncbi:hypothetical protein FDECE_4901 [Fusarium decemcellulare]|nr:hypothetical protein FDECE_4901 [Fusarium decemcellulare]